MHTMCKSEKRRYEVVDESALCPKATSLHQTWHPACPHQGHTGHSKSSLAEACFMCLCMCTTSEPLQDRMHPGDFTLLVRACTAIWICIPAEQEVSNMVMSTQWYAKNNVYNIFIYSYITGQPLDVEGSSIGRRGVEHRTSRGRGVEQRTSRGRG